MASAQSILVIPFRPARRSGRPRCRSGPALRSTSSSRLEATHGGDLMKYTFHIVDVFSSTPFGGNQLAVLPDTASISTEGGSVKGRCLQQCYAVQGHTVLSKEFY